MLPRRSQLALVRLPNILAFNPTPFDPETFEDELIDVLKKLPYVQRELAAWNEAKG